MERDELVLSDVHLQIKSEKVKEFYVSRFYYTEDASWGNERNKQLKPNKKEVGSSQKHDEDGKDLSDEEKEKDDFKHKVGSPDDDAECQFDKDGDMEVKRKKRKVDKFSALTIVHKQETSLQNVGQQIWLASLYMSDYIVSNKDEFKGKKILDLGAGIGLTSIVAALYVDQLICTDVGSEILELAEHNLTINKTKKDANFKVIELDWNDNWFDGDDEDSLGQTLTDTDISTCDIVISADVIYDDDLTDALFRTVYNIMRNTNITTWYISMEKRFVFTLKDMDIACPAYQHFRDCLDQLENMSDDIQFVATLVNDVPQCFQYDRTKELELWRVEAKTRGS